MWLLGTRGLGCRVQDLGIMQLRESVLLWRFGIRVRV